MSDSPITIPDAKNVPEEGELPSRFGKLNNLAGNDELCEKVRSFLSTQIQRFKGQEQRENFCEDGGVMDVADRMARVALRRDTASAQYQATLSNVASTAFLKGIRAMTAGECSVYFQSDELPAQYGPVWVGADFPAEASAGVCAQRQAEAEYTWMRDDRRSKVRKGTYFLNKYGQQMYSIEWDFREEEVTVRKLTDDNKVKFETKKRVVADNPTLILHDLKNMYFDSQIDSMQDQVCIGEEGAVPYNTLLCQQESGWIKNVDKITAAHLAEQDLTPATIDARSTNAGENATQTITGHIRRWNCWAYLPIVETKGSNGEWVNGALPQLYWCTFAGDITKSAVCMRLLRNPYHHKKNPYFLQHAYAADDKGAYHLSPAETVISLYWQAVTNWNQAHDNVTLRNRAPMIADGPILTANLTYKANKLIRVERGVTLKPLDVPRTTEITLEMAKELENDIYSTLGTDKPIMGIPFLGRTSASEATTAYEQARVPLLQKADDNANDLFKWMFELDAMLWDQYADPELVLSLTKADQLMEFKPSQLVGPFKVEVSAITSYETKMQRRRSFNAFLQAGYQLASPIMGKVGQVELWRSNWPDMGFKGDVNKLFPTSGDYDAARNAINESHSMLLLGNYEEVQAEENHAAHLAWHEPAQAEYDYLPDADKNPDNERRHMGHIQKHKNYMSQPQLPAPTGQQQTAEGAGEEMGAGVTAGLPGEAAGNPMEAMAGAEANL
jgi:hypothetical protein